MPPDQTVTSESRNVGKAPRTLSGLTAPQSGANDAGNRDSLTEQKAKYKDYMSADECESFEGSPTDDQHKILTSAKESLQKENLAKIKEKTCEKRVVHANRKPSSIVLTLSLCKSWHGVLGKRIARTRPVANTKPSCVVLIFMPVRRSLGLH